MNKQYHVVSEQLVLLENFESSHNFEMLKKAIASDKPSLVRSVMAGMLDDDPTDKLGHLKKSRDYVNKKYSKVWEPHEARSYQAKHINSYDKWVRDQVKLMHNFSEKNLDTMLDTAKTAEKNKDTWIMKDIARIDKEVAATNKVSNKVSNLSKQKNVKMMKRGGKLILTVAVVSAISYAVYKKYKSYDKVKAAQAAAQKSKQLAEEAKRQGKEKAYNQAMRDVVKWETRAKKYKDTK